MSRVLDRVDHWLSVERPVTYWSFWRALLRLGAILAPPFGLIAAAAGLRFTVISFAPLPFVLVAATFGYAVRDLNPLGGLISLLLAVLYGFLLWLSGTGLLLLRRPTPLLSVLAVLTFVAMVAGFGAPTIHGRRENREFVRAYREHRLSKRE